MMCWEWILLIIVFGLVSTVEAVVIASAVIAVKSKVEKDR